MTSGSDMNKWVEGDGIDHDNNSESAGIPLKRPGVDTMDIAERMSKALTYAAKLCQPFRPKSNEPF